MNINGAELIAAHWTGSHVDGRKMYVVFIKRNRVRSKYIAARYVEGRSSWIEGHYSDRHSAALADFNLLVNRYCLEPESVSPEYV